VSLGELVQLRLTWLAFGFFFFSTLVLGAVENFGPSLLRDLYGLSLTAATSGLTFYLVGGAGGLIVGGFLVRSGEGQEKVVGLCFMGSAALALLLALVLTPGWSVIGIMAAMGFGVGIAGPSRDMLVRQSTVASVGKGAFGRIYGLVYSGHGCGSRHCSRGTSNRGLKLRGSWQRQLLRTLPEWSLGSGAINRARTS
jgi:sugar phosphate permease